MQPNSQINSQQQSSNLADIHANTRCKYCSRLYYSTHCKYFYLTLIIFNIATIIWVIADYKNISGIFIF